jgi:polysaccharide pyruvyl transferase WcaK-like protein
MILHARGVNTRNKGAELMLRAMVEALEDHRLAIEPQAAWFEERADLGLYLKVAYRQIPEPWITRVHSLLPLRVRQALVKRYGLVFERDVDGIVDGSGFSYSDQFDLGRCVLAAEKNERAKRAGKPVVLLPQALGPFTSEPLRKAFVRLVTNSDLVFARDPISLEHAVSTGAPSDRIRLAPDFTCLVEGVVPDGFNRSDRLALIVPSTKLIAETTPEIRAVYLPFLAAGARELVQRGCDVRILIHEENDDAAVPELQGLLASPLPVVHQGSALELKGIISTAQIVLGSRFHALVSGLSQGVPCIGVGWSHKYEMLFQDYGCADRVVDPRIGADGLSAHLDALLDESTRAPIVDALVQHAEQEREASEAMWDSVRLLLDSAKPQT